MMNDDDDDDDDGDDEIYTCPCHKKHFARGGAVDTHMELSQEDFFAQKFAVKMPNAYPGATILCEPAQSKRMDMSQEAFCAEVTGENASC